MCSESGMVFSWNGGKDSTVLLHMIRVAIFMRRNALPLSIIDNTSEWSLHESKLLPDDAARDHYTVDEDEASIQTVFFSCSDMFPSLLSFTNDAARRYTILWRERSRSCSLVGCSSEY